MSDLNRFQPVPEDFSSSGLTAGGPLAVDIAFGFSGPSRIRLACAESTLPAIVYEQWASRMVRD